MNDFKKTGWAEDIFHILNTHQVRQVAYVPDAGHTELINLCNDNQAMVSVPLTTEEEGVALLAGAWLGGDRGVLLMQSSGVGELPQHVLLDSRVPHAPFDAHHHAR